jgi:NAD(P)-dependent dehydrogenase (short-subunit alcohol dehydrogenase family)
VRLDGKIAVITGGASAIGEAIGVRLRQEGATEAVPDLNLEAAKLTADIAGGRHAIATDVSDSAAVDAALAETEEKLGPVDVWVRGAGVGGPEGLRASPELAGMGRHDRGRDLPHERCGVTMTAAMGWDG